MLNEDFFSSEDKQVLKLKRTIAAFKKYDAERKRYIQRLQWEMEDISERYCRLKASVPKDIQELDDKYRQKIKNLKANMAGQARKIEKLDKTIRLMQDPGALARAEEVLKSYDLVQLKQENEALERQVANLRKTNNELICKLISLEKAADNNKTKANDNENQNAG